MRINPISITTNCSTQRKFAKQNYPASDISFQGKHTGAKVMSGVLAGIAAFWAAPVTIIVGAAALGAAAGEILQRADEGGISSPTQDEYSGRGKEY